MSMQRTIQSDNRSSHLGMSSRGQTSCNLATYRNTDMNESNKNAEEMLNIHKQLQEETENIVRWKASTEIKTKHLERQLQEARSIIDDQRHNLMDLQLHSEHLSQSLLKERQERELVNTKVAHTREIFLALQEQYEQLLETTKLLEQDKDCLTSEHKDIIKQLYSLQHTSQSHQNTIQSIIAKSQEDISRLEKVKEAMQDQMSVKDQELLELSEKISHFQVTVKNLTETLNSTEANLNTTEVEKTSLEIQLEEARATMTKTQEELKEKMELLACQAVKFENELNCGKLMYEESQKEFQEAVDKIKYLKKTNDTLEGGKSELADKVSALTSRKQELEKEIAYKTEAIEVLECSQFKNLEEINQLQERVAGFCVQLSNIQEECRNLQLEKENLLSELETSKKGLTNEEQHVKQLEEQMRSLKETMEHCHQLNGQIEEEKKTFETQNQELNETVKLLRDKLLAMEETVSELQTTISSAEENEATMKEQILHIENLHKNSSLELLAKTEKCEDLAQTVKELKAEIKKLEKELKLKTKNVSQESKVKKKHEQKIASLMKEIKTLTEAVIALESKLKGQKALLATMENKTTTQDKQLSESTKDVKDLKLLLDRSICENQELQYKLEAKTESLEAYQKITKADIERLQDDLFQKEEELNRSLLAHEQELKKVQDELDKTKEVLNNSSVHEQEFKDNADNLLTQIANMELAHKKEKESLKGEVEAALQEKNQAQEEASLALKERSHAILESDKKVNEMLGLLDRYKEDKETKLKEFEERLQNSQALVTQLTSEKESLMAEVSALKADAEELRMEIISLQGTTKSMPIKADETVFKTPSPAQYLRSMPTFAEPLKPKSPCVQKTEEPPSEQMQSQAPGILKTGRRMLLPPENKKRVVFLASTGNGEASGDSSSDAYNFEAADSDDPFEEMKRTGRNLSSIRVGKIPKANIAPIIRSVSTPGFHNNQTPAIHNRNATSSFFGSLKRKGVGELSHKKKKAKRDIPKHTIKTYSGLSPKQKTTAPSTSSVPVGREWTEQ
ncbi:synaptonemal complex protein 1 [Procambarus clarkii]|uniref:synaptonemal complex protein 1 n=1 Tax=Procambarus clarkii TaxID=6728 RepID=UPI003742E7DB